jgi:hypothetical protein
LSELVQNVQQAIAARPSGCIAKAVETYPPPFKGNVTDAVESRRQKGCELKAKPADIRNRPWPSELAKKRERDRAAHRGRESRD